MRANRHGRREPARPQHEDSEDDVAFDGLHWLTAGLFLAAGSEAGVGERRGDHRAADHAVRWGPLIAAPLAGAAHAARALFPGRASRNVAQILNGVAVAVGSAGLAGSLYTAIGEDAPGRGLFGQRRRVPERLPSFAPLTFAIAGLLGVLLDREERLVADEQDEIREEIRRLRRRASVVERLVPARKRKLDRVVVHL